MAKTTGSYQTAVNEKYLLNALNFFHRNYPAPVDDTMVWDTVEDLQAYIAAPGSYAYPGQIVSVANGTVEESNGAKDFDLYVIRANKSLQKVSGTKSYMSMELAQADLANMTVGAVITIWNQEKSKYEIYTCETAEDPGHDNKKLVRQSFDPSDIPEISWDNLTGKPTSSVTDIDAAVTLSKRFSVDEDTDNGGANKSVSFEGKKLAYFADIPTTYDATKLVGEVPIASIPKAAMPEWKQVANETARLALTNTDVQTGDVVFQEDTQIMYYVKDDTKLGAPETAADAFKEFQAGVAAAVEWSNVRNKPNTLTGYGITDAVNQSEVSVSAGANKIAKANGDGKLEYSITGDAGTLGGHAANYFATKDEHDTLAGKVSTLEGSNTTLTQQVEANKTAIEQINTTELPNIKSGDAITALAASKLTGVVDRTHLPTDVSGMGVEVDSQEARYELQNTTVHNGWIVRQRDTNAVYVVIDDTKLSEEGGYMLLVSNGGATTAWSSITGTPNTLSGYGITDAVNASEVVNAAEANKILKLNGDGKLPADITGSAATLEGHNAAYFATKNEHDTLTGTVAGHTADITGLKDGTLITALEATKLTGTIPLERLPHGALERMVVVENTAGRLALTKENVQNGDTVCEEDTGKMYYVVDEDNLASEDGYHVYTAGAATSVPWSGVTGKPTTVDGYGITDAVKTTDVVEVGGVGNAGKLIKIGADGKLNCQISGKVDWRQLENGPTSGASAIDGAVTKAEHANRTQLDKIGEKAGTDAVTRLTYDGTEVATLKDCQDAMLKVLPLVDTESEMVNAVEGQFCLVKLA